MGTRVEEGAHATVLTADHEDRDAQVVVRAVGAWFAHVAAEADECGGLREDQILFACPLFRIRVGRDWLPNRTSRIGRRRPRVHVVMHQPHAVKELVVSHEVNFS